MIADWVRQHSIVSYVLVAYTITWLIALPMVLSFQGLISMDIPFTLHFLLPLGPLLSSLIVTRSIAGTDGLRNIFGRMSRWRVRPIWFAVAFFSVWIVYAASSIIQIAIGQSWPDLAIFGNVLYMPYLTFIGAWLLWICTYGIGEETGWRGFMLPQLQERYSPLVASLIVSIFWAGWHLPMFLYNENLISMGPFGTIFWVIGLMFGSILLTWLYNSSGKSILMVALWHGTFNLFTAAVGQAVELSAGIISMFVMIWVVIIIFRSKGIRQGFK